MNQIIGSHIKFKTDLSSLINDAINLQINSFQFFILKESKKYPKLYPSDLKYFLEKKTKFKKIYIHGSYWINLATGKKIAYESSKKTLQKEIFFAKKLGVNNEAGFISSRGNLYLCRHYDGNS